MSFLSRFSKKIEDQEWDHTSFLRNVLLLMVIIVLFFYLFLFILQLNGLVTEDYFINAITSLLRGNLFGVVTGILSSFVVLLYYYIRKEWDLHIVIPSSLFFHVIFSFVVFLLVYFTDFGNQLFVSSLLTGFLLGGLIPILAYSGEVDKEH